MNVYSDHDTSLTGTLDFVAKHTLSAKNLLQPSYRDTIHTVQMTCMALSLSVDAVSDTSTCDNNGTFVTNGRLREGLPVMTPSITELIYEWL